MAVLTAGNMKNKISFYRESFVVNTESGEKSKTVSLIKKDVGAEFKYIGTPSAGASEDNIQEQRTGKIKAEIRCRYFRGIKFEDIIYFEGGKFRIYSIQYEGRHEVLKLRAELRDDDTYFGLPDQEYEFLPVQSEFHFRTNADYEVVENVPFPKETNGEYIFESESETYDLLTVFLGIGSAPSTTIKSVRDRFPYSSSGTSMFPDAVGGVVQESPFSYTSPWYLPNPSLSAPYAKVVVGDIVLAEKNDNNAILVGSGDDTSPYQDANGEWTYTIDTAGFPNISEPFYHLQFGYNPASLFYRLGTISGGTEYYSRLNARDVENSITKISGYGVITKDYELPMQVFNGCLSCPTDIKARTLRQSGQLSGRMSVSSQEPLLVSSSKEIAVKPEEKVIERPRILAERNAKKVSALSLKSIQRKQQLKKEQLANQPEEENLPVNEFTEAQMQSVWDEYTQKIETDGKFNLLSHLTMGEPKLEGDLIHLKVPNQTIKTEVERAKYELLGFLREQLQNYNIDLSIEVNETIAKKYAYTPREKFEKLKEKNPLLEKLRKDFDLDI